MTNGTALLDPTPQSPAMTAYEEHDVTGLNSVAHLFPKSKGRSGIYVLTFRNGDRYVGKSVNVVARVAGHRLTYGDDIVGVAFQRVSLRNLDDAERAEIQRFETAGALLRNVVHVGGRRYASDLDTIVTPMEQSKWLSAQRLRRPDPAQRPNDPAQRHRLAAYYARLAADYDFAGVLKVLKRYVRAAVPHPARTELTYWSLSAAPTTNKYYFPRLFTLSVQTLETLWAGYDYSNNDDFEIRLNVDRNTLLDTWGTLRKLERAVPGLTPYEAAYRARPGVIALTTYSCADAERLLGAPAVLAAARRLNLDLMRKGPTMHWRTHNFALADHIYE